MKKIILVRHGEALPTSLGSMDYDRVLSEKGKTFVAAQAVKINANNWPIDYIICSAAKRTRQTGVILVDGMSMSKDLIHFESKIYEAPMEQLLEVFEQLPDDKSTVLWVGHNPGISQLSYYLSGSPFSFSPGNVCVIDLDITNWFAHYEACGKMLKQY